MKTYWDSSALVFALHHENILKSIAKPDHFTRIHAVAEMFSTLTKGVMYRYPAEDASRMIEELAGNLTLVELSYAEVISATKMAKKLGVRGARIHDLLHSVAAQRVSADILMTLDTAGFS